MEPKDLLTAEREKKGLSQQALANLVGISSRMVQRYEQGLFPKYKADSIIAIDKLLGTNLSDIIYDKSVPHGTQIKGPKPDPVDAWRLGEPGEELITKSKHRIFDLGGGRYLMETPLVQPKAYAGYLTGWGDQEYLEELPTHAAVVDKPHKGEYISFEVAGDSMDNGRPDAIQPGDIVLGRKIDRSFWKSKLHYKKYKEFVIVTLEGVLIKGIADHNTDANTILCRSANPDKEKYPDKVIHLGTVMQILNVVQVTKKR